MDIEKELSKLGEEQDYVRFFRLQDRLTEKLEAIEGRSEREEAILQLLLRFQEERRQLGDKMCQEVTRIHEEEIKDEPEPQKLGRELGADVQKRRTAAAKAAETRKKRKAAAQKEGR